MTKGRRTRIETDPAACSGTDALTLSTLRAELTSFKNSLREEIIKDVNSLIAEKFNELNNKILEQENEIALLKSHLMESERQCLRRPREELASYVVIVGITEEDNETTGQLTTKVENVFKALDVTDVGVHDCSITRVDRPNGKRVIKVTTKSREHRRLLLSNARSLRKYPVFHGVYVEADRCFLDRQESARLRHKAKTLRSDFPDSEVRLTRGRLLLNGEEIDREDPLKQLFPKY